MQLEELIQIIELTDTDTFAEAIETYNLEGMVSNRLLPFMGIVFDKAPEQLCKKLSDVGFKGRPDIVRFEGQEEKGNYLVYDSALYSKSEIQKVAE